MFNQFVTDNLFIINYYKFTKEKQSIYDIIN